MLDFSVEALENSNLFTRKPLWWRFLFCKVPSLEFIPTI